MITASASDSSTILSGRKLSRVRIGWWVLFVSYTIFAVFEIWQLLSFIPRFHLSRSPILFTWSVNLIATIVSWVLALSLFRKKSSDWAVILVTVMFFSGAPAAPFWFWALNHGWGPDISTVFINAQLVSKIIGVPFDIFGSVVRMGVFLTFPTGQWISPKAKRLFWISLSVFIVTRLVNIGNEILYNTAALSDIVENLVPASNFAQAVSYIILPIIWLLAGYMLFTHYRKMQDSIQRQQIKWIVVFFFISVCASALVTLFYAPLYLGSFFTSQSGFLEIYNDIGQWLTIPLSLLNLGLVIAFSLSVFRYRLWDVDLLINKTLVYSSLTALLGGIVVVSTALINYAIKQWFGEEQSSVWAVVISALPVATAFNPLRERLQKWVDHYFKPEEVNFSDSFIEFKPEVQEILTTPHIIQILSEQVKKQLNVDFARVYLLKEDNNLHQVDSASTSKEYKKLELDEKLLTQLKEGKVVVDDDGIPYSLLVPLVVPRARIPDFLGLIVLGRRLNGKGYSTQILNNLQALGADAGKAIYLSRLNEWSKQKRKRPNK